MTATNVVPLRVVKAVLASVDPTLLALGWGATRTAVLVRWADSSRVAPKFAREISQMRRLGFLRSVGIGGLRSGAGCFLLSVLYGSYGCLDDPENLWWLGPSNALQIARGSANFAVDSCVWLTILRLCPFSFLPWAVYGITVS